MKKLARWFMVVLLVITTVLQPMGTAAYAATITSAVPIQAYTISTGRVNTYRSVKGNYTGYIDGSTDLCKITALYDSGWCEVYYPTSRGMKKAYTQTSNFFTNVDFSNATTTLGKGLTAYRRSSGNQRLGSVYANDSVIVVGQKNGRTQVIYPVSGGYKLGWVAGSYSASSESVVDVPNGYYQIVSKGNTDYVLDVSEISMNDGANIWLIKNCHATNQVFAVEKQSNGYYTLKAVHSGKVLDVYEGGKFNGANVIQYRYHGGDNQLWQIVKTSDGYYKFKNKNSGLYLDVNGAIFKNCTNIQVWEGNNSAAQNFRLDAVTVDGKAYQDSPASTFQLPLQNACCTWRSYTQWSWSNNATGGSGRVYHLGIDIHGTSDDVMATASGTVAATGWSDANGNYVILSHKLNGKTIYSFYAHLKSVSVRQGASVNQGDKIGVVGNTGSSSRGKHLHFAMMDTLWSNGRYYGYSTYFTGQKRNYSGVTYYNPIYVIENGKLPE